MIQRFWLEVDGPTVGLGTPARIWFRSVAAARAARNARGLDCRIWTVTYLGVVPVAEAR